MRLSGQTCLWLGAIPLTWALEIISLSRTLEVGGTVARAQTTLVCSGTAEDTELHVYQGNEKEGKLAWLDVTEQKTKRPLEVSEGQGETYIVHVPSDILQGGNVTVTFSEVLTHASEPRPKQLQQAGDAQLMMWTGDLMGGFGRGRSIDQVSVKVKAPTANVNSYTAPAGFKATRPSGSATVTFTGSAKAVGVLEATVHYEQPDPVMSFRTYTRHVEVSHWSSTLAIKDDIQLINDGPQLKGQFSRLTHQQQSMMRSATGYNHVLSGMILTLPPGAKDPYFVDTVGNVSTSNFRPAPPMRLGRARGATLEIKPRYPIFGGWKYDFTIGFNLPLASHLRHDASGGLYHLAVPFLTTTKETAVDHVVTRIVLPEGATDIRIHPPFAAEPRLTTYTTFLDTTGRPAVVIERPTCTDKHMVDVHISYRYTKAALLIKPLAVASIAFAVFLIGIGLRRMTWQIGKTPELLLKKGH